MQLGYNPCFYHTFRDEALNGNLIRPLDAVFHMQTIQHKITSVY